MIYLLYFVYAPQIPFHFDDMYFLMIFFTATILQILWICWLLWMLWTLLKKFEFYEFHDYCEFCDIDECCEFCKRKGMITDMLFRAKNDTFFFILMNFIWGAKNRAFPVYWYSTLGSYTFLPEFSRFLYRFPVFPLLCCTLYDLMQNMKLWCKTRW